MKRKLYIQVAGKRSKILKRPYEFGGGAKILKGFTFENEAEKSNFNSIYFPVSESVEHFFGNLLKKLKISHNY